MDLVSVGESMIDFLPDRAGALRYVRQFSFRLAGAESNVAVGMSKLGHSAGWISKLGEDEFAAFALRELRGEGVDVSRVTRSADHPTGLMFKQFNPGGETGVQYYRKGSAASTLSPEDIDWDYVRQAKILHLSGVTTALSDSCARTNRRLADFARENGILLSFDPNIRLKLWSAEQAMEALLPLLQMCDIALLGADEGRMILGTDDPAEIIRILRDCGVRYIGVKDGGKGAVAADRDLIADIPAVKVQVEDSIGAGDAFNAGFLSGILEGRDIASCGAMGALMGVMAVTARGDVEGLPDRPQFDRIINNTGTIYR